MTNTLESELTVLENENEAWQSVCPLLRLIPERGVAALVGGRPVALFRLEGPEGTRVFAVDHIDPRMQVPTMARGLVGSVGDEPTVAAPLLKEKYSLVTGQCFTNPEYQLPVFDVRVHDGQIYVRTNVIRGKQA